ncbi:inner membrane protein [Escherichia coli]|nr:inner membrane protein [Escherichia coli]
MNLRPVLLMLERLKRVGNAGYLPGRIGVASIKVQDYAHIQAVVGLFSFVALVILTTVTLSHLNVEELWERFYPQRPLRVGTRNFVSVLGAILPAILISVVAARVAISRYACVAVIVCKNAGRRC